MPNKTNPKESDVTMFVESLKNQQQKEDSYELIKIITNVTGYLPKMWGASIIGFGSYHYKYDSGHEGDSAIVGFSPRSTAISLYLFPEFKDKELLLEQFGKVKVGKGCIYIKALKDVNSEILTRMLENSVQAIKEKFNVEK